MQNTLQRTSDWRDVRSGRFTGSEIHKLLGAKGLGETGKSYAFEKAIEIVYGRNQEETFTSFDMQRGVDLEPIALEKLKQLKALEFINVEPCFFFPYEDNAGASPDAIVGDDACAELKAPRATKFFKLVAKGEEVIDSEYVAQMQMEILCTNSQRCHFFNYIIYNGKPMWHEIVVQRDEKMIDFIKQRIKEAVEVRDEFVETLKKNQQF